MVWAGTVGQVADRAVELGIVAPAAVTGLAEHGLRDQPLSNYGQDNAGAFLALMEECGVAVRVDSEVDNLLEGYRELFGRFSAATGGAVTITDVELYDGGERIRMLVNGDQVDWHVEHESDWYLDTLSVFEISGRLVPRDDTDPREFLMVTNSVEYPGCVFADRAALSVLAAELGVELA